MMWLGSGTTQCEYIIYEIHIYGLMTLLKLFKLEHLKYASK